MTSLVAQVPVMNHSSLDAEEQDREHLAEQVLSAFETLIGSTIQPDSEEDEQEIVGIDNVSVTDQEIEQIEEQPAVSVQSEQSFPPVCKGLPVEVWERIMTYLHLKDVYVTSQLSQQHLAISKNPFFRARYFCAHHMRCQAIYYASCKPKLFTPELLQCLLSLGAVLSRDFCQSILQRNLGIGKHRGHPRWALQLSACTIVAILQEGIRLYGDSLKLQQSNGSEIKSWTDSPARLSLLSDQIREIFVTGRFAIFSGEDATFLSPYSQASSPLANAVAHHPELVQILRDNGYEHSKAEQETIVLCMLHRHNDNEALLYERLDALLTQFPDWSTSGKSTDDIIRIPYTTSFAPVPWKEAGQRLLAENNGIGPIRKTIITMKRFYDEGRAFHRMGQIVRSYALELTSNKNRGLRDSAPTFRILYKLFPEAFQGRKADVAASYIGHFENEFKEATVAELSRGHESLLDLLEELCMTTDEWKDLLTRESIAYEKLLVGALERGVFGAVERMERDDKIRLLDELIARCLEYPMTGHHLQELEVVSNKLFSEEIVVSKYNTKTNTIFMDRLEKQVMEWQLDLETLQPDRKYISEAKLRTPIAWLAKGVFCFSNHHSYTNFSTSLSDIHILFPFAHKPRHGNETTSLTFVNTKKHMIDLMNSRSAKVQPRTPKEMIETDIVTVNKASDVGWRHIGHVDDLVNAANDSGVFFVESKEETAVQPKDVDVASSAEIKALETTASNTTIVGKNIWTGKSGNFPSCVRSVIRSYCVSCYLGESSCCCSSLSPYHRQAKEMATKLPIYLPPSSPALCDVILAHALINGNEPVVRYLMSGLYGEENMKGSEEAKPLSKTADLVKARQGKADMPVLPTLAHLRILQAIERKPVPEFIDRIIEGAPFKRGYVKSNLEHRTKESDFEKRREWYAKEDHKDDRSFTALFNEKSRLEEIDKANKKKPARRSATGRTQTKSKDVGVKGENESSVPNRTESGVSKKAVSNSRTSRRAHLQRSAASRVVQYREAHSISSDEEDGQQESLVRTRPNKKQQEEVKDLDELKVAEMLSDPPSQAVSQSTTRYRYSANSVTKLDDIFGNSSELSDLSSDTDEEVDPKKMRNQNESETEDSERDRDVADMYGFIEFSNNLPIVMVTLGNEEQGIPLDALIRRCRSLALWLDHLRLLLWFERRKERFGKEAAARAREAGNRWERAGKSKFSNALSDMIRRIEPMEEAMQVALFTALQARKLAVAKLRRDAKNGKTKKIAVKVRRTIKVDSEEAGTLTETTSTTKKVPQKRKRGKNGETVEEEAPASSSRKKKQATKGKGVTISN